ESVGHVVGNQVSGFVDGGRPVDRGDLVHGRRLFGQTRDDGLHPGDLTLREMLECANEDILVGLEVVRHQPKRRGSLFGHRAVSQAPRSVASEYTQSCLQQLLSTRNAASGAAEPARAVGWRSGFLAQGKKS